jgi:hypothetical protein
MLLLGAVAVGELALRFLQLLGAATGRAAGGASGAQAAAAAAAGRLRELTAVPAEAGPARDALAVSLEVFWCLFVRQREFDVGRAHSEYVMLPLLVMLLVMGALRQSCPADDAASSPPA